MTNQTSFIRNYFLLLLLLKYSKDDYFSYEIDSSIGLPCICKQAKDSIPRPSLPGPRACSFSFLNPGTYMKQMARAFQLNVCLCFFLQAMRYRFLSLIKTEIN